MGTSSMTQDEWHSSTDPTSMIRFLIGCDPLRIQDVETFPDCIASNRKLRLFACACWHRTRHLLRSPLAQDAVTVAERFVEDRASLQELQQIAHEVGIVLEEVEQRWRETHGAERGATAPVHYALALAGAITWAQAQKAAYYASFNASYSAAAIMNPELTTSDSGFATTERAEKRAQADLLRDIFGDPFCPVAVDPLWLLAPVPARALFAYGDRLTNGTLVGDRLAVLADALEEAGCSDARILDHLRGPGPHYRGCWALDSVLAKE